MAAAPLPTVKPTPLVTTAGEDLRSGLLNWELYGRLGWLDVKRRYRRTVLGPLWGVVNLGLFIAALGSIGVGLWKQDAEIYLPFLTSGLVLWVLFSAMITEGCTVFIHGQNFVRQMRFDYSILVYALVWRNLITFLHNLIIYFIVVLLFAPHILRPSTLLAVPGVAFVLANGAWISLLLGICCMRFRDIQQLVTTLIQISIFITPIFWPPSLLEGTYRAIFVAYNPIYHLIEIARAPLINELPTASSYFAVLLMTIVGWTCAYAVFGLYRRRLSYWS